MSGIRAELIRNGIPVPKEPNETPPPRPPPPPPFVYPVRLRQWPWYALQVGVAGGLTVWMIEYNVTPNPYLGAALAFGGAYLATISLRGLIDLCARANALVRKHHQPAEDVERIAAARRHLSDLRKPHPRFRIREKRTDLLDPPAKPPTL